MSESENSQIVITTGICAMNSERKQAWKVKHPEGESFSDFSGNPRKCQLCIGIIINTIGHHACIPDSRAEWQ